MIMNSQRSDTNRDDSEMTNIFWNATDPDVVYDDISAIFSWTYSEEVIWKSFMLVRTTITEQELGPQSLEWYIVRMSKTIDVVSS